MKTNWHVQAVRLAAQHPYKPWGEICKMVGSRRSCKASKPSVKQYATRMEQLKLF